MSRKPRSQNQLKRAVIYPLIGVILSFLMPVGWLVFRVAPVAHSNPDHIFFFALHEITEHSLQYGYMHVGALLMLVSAGFALGWRDDRLREHYANLLSQRRLLAIKNRQLARLSITDRLTGLANYFRFNEILAIEFKRAQRYSLDLCVIMVDIDHFKSINDHLGHYFGDYVLHELGQILASIRRESDSVARTGGEEFSFILTQTGIEDALRFAERLREAVAKHSFEHDGKKRQVTLSAGVASIKDLQESDDEDKGKRLMILADEALYTAKRLGRNRVERWRPRPVEVTATAR